MMKKIYTILIVSLVLLATVQAQSEVDALRYSQNFIGGTARAISMGGAFGALGGDFTTVSLNPAGLGVYRSTELTFTPTLLYDNTTGNYLGQNSVDNKYRFMVNNLGFVHTSLTGKDEGWIGVTFGLGYNQLNSFNRNTSMKGTMLSGGANSSSLLDNFTNWANDTPGADQDQSSLNAFYEGLAWETWMMNVDSLGFWNELWNQYYGQSQRRRIVESGGIGEYAFSVGANYGNRLYVGGTFGIHRVRYTSEVLHKEMDDARIIYDFNSFTFREMLDTRGTGYTFKVGMIFRPISLIRLGASFHLPTFYNMKESFYTDMQSDFDNGDEYYAQSPTNEFEYWLRTPWKAIGSAAVQLGRVAIISADYEYMDYREMNMDSRSTDDELLSQNDRIREIYSAAHNIRVGAELHLGPMYLRGGASYYDSPYKKIAENGKNGESYYITLNGGIGFRSKSVFFDLAYSHRLNEYEYWLYIPEDVNGATINTKNNQVAATLGFRF